jgi:hypothetical protein
MIHDADNNVVGAELLLIRCRHISLSIDFLKNLLVDTIVHSALVLFDPDERRDEGFDPWRTLRGDVKGVEEGDDADEDEDEDEHNTENGANESKEDEWKELRRSERSSKCLASTRKGKLNEKTDPFPITLCVEMMLEGLLMLFTKDNEIERPRPVPSKTRVELVSAWKKASKMFFWTSSSIPIPVSITLNSSTIGLFSSGDEKEEERGLHCSQAFGSLLAETERTT